MFGTSWIDDLDANAAADALARAHREALAAEAQLFVLAGHWAKLHNEDSVPLRDAQLPGRQRVVPIRGGRRGCVDGCPEVAEYAGAELAALTGRSTAAGEQLMSDAVAVEHRHPLLFSALRAGQAPVWLAGKVARACIRAGLDVEQVERVDAETTPYIATLPPAQFLELVEAKIIAADPQGAEERARAKSLARFVHAGRTDEYGLRTIVARAHAGDVTFVVAVLDRIAGILAERGDERPLEVLRAEALRLLANPARALALLTEATLDELDPDVETPGDLAQQALFPHGDTGGLLDAGGRLLPGAYPNLAELPVLDDDELAQRPECQALLGTGPTIGATVGAATEPSPGTVGDPAAQPDRVVLTALLDALSRFDTKALDPVTILHVHLSEAALTSRQGVVRVEELGPVVLDEVRDWLTHPTAPDQIQQQLTIRPVLDVDAVVPVSRYEWPEPMDELATCRTPYETFPFGTLSSRKADNDHARRFVKDGPPGQTCLENNAKLGRFHHRLKTNGNWILRHPEPGIYWWRTPHGHWFLVDTEGTHWHGRDSALDDAWLREERPHEDRAA
jgi:hypothetical protein